MKLIIENLGGQFFAYMENECHFKKVEKTRPNRVNPLILNIECNLEAQLNVGEHFVFDIQPPKKDL